AFALHEQFRRADVHHHAEIVGIAFDLLEEEDRWNLLRLAQRIERAHFQIRVGAFDDLELAHLLGELDASAKIAQRRVAPRLLVTLHAVSTLMRRRLWPRSYSLKSGEISRCCKSDATCSCIGTLMKAAQTDGLSSRLKCWCSTPPGAIGSK